jgi:hypothetical protein
MIKRVFQAIGLLSMILGVMIIINSPTNIIGAVINTKVMPKGVSIAFGFFFLLCGTFLFLLEKKR